MVLHWSDQGMDRTPAALTGPGGRIRLARPAGGSGRALSSTHQPVRPLRARPGLSRVPVYSDLRFAYDALRPAVAELTERRDPDGTRCGTDPGGRRADRARLLAYEHRSQQLEMARAISTAIQTSSHLVVEAGTGVGKSFAYLVPAILAATRRRQDEDNAKRIVISTHTISLQEQLIGKDIPFLNAVMPVEFSAVLVKGGRTTSVCGGCRRRVERGFDSGESPKRSISCGRFRRWAKTHDGRQSGRPGFYACDNRVG